MKYILSLTKLIFEITFLLAIGILERMIQLIDKNYRIELEGFE